MGCRDTGKGPGAVTGLMRCPGGDTFRGQRPWATRRGWSRAGRALRLGCGLFHGSHSSCRLLGEETDTEGAHALGQGTPA